MMHSIWAGVDFGSRIAGTTAITFLVEDQLKTVQVQKGQDTDLWLSKMIADYHLNPVFIDAPLSLPDAYFHKGEDFNFRSADRILKAMSPMFLGGLTARAMKLKTTLSKIGISCIEVYPGGFVRQNPGFITIYHKKNPTAVDTMFDALYSNLPFEKVDRPMNIHQLDSLISWYIGYRYIIGIAQSFGDPDEGLIWI